jgi:RecA/RadA recombinase
MSELLSRLKKNSNLEYTTTLSDSSLFKERSQTPTEVPIINLAFSGTFSKGFGSGITMFAGPSKHFKSNLGLLCVRSYLKRHKDAICIYYDSEFGCTPEYLKAAGIDPNRVLHTPIMDVEELKFDIVRQLEEIKKGEKVIIFIDSVGNLASKKELEDAKSEKSAADMSRAKQLKSLWRMVTPYLTMKDLPCIVVNHSYETQEIWSKTVVSGGSGGIYSSNTIFIITKAQEKEDDEIAGYKFTLNVDKSRFVKEKSKFPFIVTYERGVNIWSGLMDIALETGHVIKPKNGWYTRPCVENDKSWRLKDSNSSTFWKPIFENTDFKQACKERYSLGVSNMVDEENPENQVSNIDLNDIDVDG